MTIKRRVGQPQVVQTGARSGGSNSWWASPESSEFMVSLGVNDSAELKHVVFDKFSLSLILFLKQIVASIPEPWTKIFYNVTFLKKSSLNIQKGPNLACSLK